MRAFLRCLVLPAWLALAGLSPGIALAQAPAVAPPSSGQGEGPGSMLVSGDIRAIRSTLETAKLELDQLEATLLRRELSDAELQDLRQQTDPVSQTVRGLVDELQPRVDA